MARWINLFAGISIGSAIVAVLVVFLGIIGGLA